jgi:hypothetical protein
MGKYRYCYWILTWMIASVANVVDRISLTEAMWAGGEKTRRHRRYGSRGH